MEDETDLEDPGKNLKKKQGMARLLALSERGKGFLVCGIALGCIGSVLQLVPYLASWRVITSLMAGVSSGSAPEAGSMLWWGAVGLAGLLSGTAASWIAGIAAHAHAYRTVCDIRIAVAEHVGRLPMGYLDSSSIGQVEQVMDADVEQVEAFLAHQVPDLASALATLIVLFVLMFAANVWLALACLAPIVIGIACQLQAMAKVMKTGAIKKNFDVLERINSSAIQYVEGMPAIKAFGQTTASFRGFKDDTEAYRDFTVGMTDQIRPGYVRFRVFTLSVATFAAPVAIALFLGNPSDVALAAVCVFALVVGPAASSPVLKLRMFAESVNTVNEAVGRVCAVLDLEPQGQVSQDVRATPQDAGIAFDHVTFSYPGAENPAVDGVSFAVEPGSTCAIVGPSGAGKSTIAELVGRFWDVDEGMVRIGGVDVRELGTDALMDIVAFVFQDSFLFAGTIRDNIAMGLPSATEDQIAAAASAAQCDEFLARLPKGIDTVVGAGGVRLSGGERQRVAIARAILKSAPILILDEASSFADAQTQFSIHRALAELTRGKTVLTIAHRLETVQSANQIIVMDKGRIVQRGRHDELIEVDGPYADMWVSGDRAADWKLGTEKAEVSL